MSDDNHIFVDPPDTPIDNVVRLKPKIKPKEPGAKPATPIANKPGTSLWDKCKHDCTYIDLKTRELECQKCGAVCDPFDVLANQLTMWTRWSNEWDSLHRDVKQMREERHDLKRQITNLKAQRRRLAPHD